MKPGDVAIIFTPDDTHFTIAAAAINAGLHVLVAKPIVKTLAEHTQLVALAKKNNVLVSGCRQHCDAPTLQQEHSMARKSEHTQHRAAVAGGKSSRHGCSATDHSPLLLHPAGH